MRLLCPIIVRLTELLLSYVNDPITRTQEEGLSWYDMI